MTALTVDRIAELPDVTLDGDGPWAARFRAVGLRSFQGACRWMQSRPYGANVRSDAAAVFDEGRGTCRSKHGAVALLAAELGVPVHRYVGGYRLDPSIAPGAAGILDAHGLTYVPQLHCVLGHGDGFIDLTSGNRHGKARDIGRMDIYFRTDPFPGVADDDAMFSLAVAYYRATDPAMSACQLSLDGLRHVARACLKTTVPPRAVS